MAVIAVSNQKGGSAKTTTTIHVGAALAAQGKRVLLIDMDPQGHLAEGFGLAAAELEHEISEVLDRRQELIQIIVPVRANLDLAPANIHLAHVEPALINKHRREDRLKMALQPVASEYDYVLIDCPPSLGILTVNALSAANQVLIPMAADYYSMLGVGLLLTSIDEMRAEINPTLTVLGLIPTRVSRTVNAREVLNHIKGELAGRVRIFLEEVPETVKFREAAGLGKTIFEHAPETPGAAAYNALAMEVIGERQAHHAGSSRSVSTHR
jgi:chromosome partitioning protein